MPDRRDYKAHVQGPAGDFHEQPFESNNPFVMNRLGICSTFHPQVIHSRENHFEAARPESPGLGDGFQHSSQSL
jgi:hypothetical protein